ANDEQGPDLITFAPGLTGTITLTTGQLEVRDSVTILGPGAGVLTVSGNNASRIFLVANAARDINVAISGLTLTQGLATDNGSAAGAIFVPDEGLALSGMVIPASSAQSGGGINIATRSRLTLENSTVSGNFVAGPSAAFGGGLFLGDNSATLIRNSTISENRN